MRALGFVALGSVSLLAGGAAFAQAAQPQIQPGPTNIGAVSGTASLPADDGTAAATTAAQFAPSRAPLNATEPTSVIGTQALRKIDPPIADYNDAALLTPSAMDIAPAGPGLQQDFGQSIRGLQYTEFSVLWDGIPIPGFPFNQAPQPGAYFLARDFSSITVNRGPGPASAIGAATFGGSLDLATVNPTADSSLETYGTFGSFGTKFYGIQGNSGTLDETGGTRATLDLTREEANGALTGISTERRNLFLKVSQPVGANTVVTAAVNLDNDDTLTPYGATLQDIQLYGRNYALNANPASQSFAGYNRDNYTTDFAYVDVDSALGDGWRLDNKVFTTSYIQRDRHGLDPDGTAPNLNGTIYVGGQAVNANNDVPGLYGHFDFQDWGDVLRLTKTTPYGDFRFGSWIDRQGLTFYQYNVDITRGGVAYTTAPGASPYAGQFFAPTLTVEPYAEFAWRPATSVTVTAGIKYASVTRALTGPIGLDGMPSDFHATYNKPLPSFDANWRVTHDWSLFAQAARGYLTPPLNLFSTTAVTSVRPSTTWSFQVGTVWQRHWLTLGADAYDIEFNNYINSNTVAGETVFFNQGGATFRGLELETTAKLGYGFAAYVNGSLNDSTYGDNGNNLAQTPRRTAVAALLYDRGSVIRENDDVFGSALVKEVGPQYGVDTANPGQHDQFPIKSWSEVDASIGYILPVLKHRLKISANANNLLDNRSLTGIFGETLEGSALYAAHAGRSVFFSFSALL